MQNRGSRSKAPHTRKPRTMRTRAQAFLAFFAETITQILLAAVTLTVPFSDQIVITTAPRHGLYPFTGKCSITSYTTDQVGCPIVQSPCFVPAATPIVRSKPSLIQQAFNQIINTRVFVTPAFFGSPFCVNVAIVIHSLSYIFGASVLCHRVCVYKSALTQILSGNTTICAQLYIFNS